MSVYNKSLALHTHVILSSVIVVAGHDVKTQLLDKHLKWPSESATDRFNLKTKADDKTNLIAKLSLPTIFGQMR
jgi:hypothetical protein